jgi:hypothetical protein
MDKKKEIIVDLDINNYELNDLLELFNLKTIYDLEDLKTAKKIVLKMHPDKSKLLPEYFLFYCKAYKRLCSLYLIKNKNLQKIEETEYTKDIDESIKNVLDKNIFLQENKNFNKAFNEMFEKHNIKEKQGYGEWLKDTYEHDNKIEFDNNISWDDKINIKKKEMKTLVKYNGVDNLFFNTSASFIDDEVINNNSDLFSSLTYQDLKQAHTETLIPVTDEDYDNVLKFNTLNEYKIYRDKDQTNWFGRFYGKNNKNNKDFLNKIEDEENQIIYGLARQMEIEKRQYKGNK